MLEVHKELFSIVFWRRYVA